MEARVRKFGGTSVAGAAGMERVARIVGEERGFVVLSAMSGVTQSLIDLVAAATRGEESHVEDGLGKIHRLHLDAVEALFPDAARREAVERRLEELVSEAGRRLKGIMLLDEASPRSRDAVISTGERLSVAVFTAYQQSRGVDAVHADARTWLRTDDRFGEARPIDKQVVADLVAPLREAWNRGQQVVTEGFLGATTDGAVTTLGRGGSDYTAAVLGAAVGASEVEIWTDVGGVMTSDPRRVGVARWVPRLSYAEAAELSYFGAKVLHPDTVHPAVENGIPLRVLNTMHPEHPGTIIDAEGDHGIPVKAITSKSRVVAITIESGRMLGSHGFLRRVFEAFDRHRISVDVVATAEVSVTITMDPHPALPAVIAELEEVARVKVAEGRAILTLVGEGIRFAPNLCQRVFGSLEGINVELISMGASRLNLSLVIEGHQLEGALRSIHRAIFEEAE